MTARMRVAVVVLGPLARSPRMLNHAMELARRGHQVSIAGFQEQQLDLPVGIRVLTLGQLRRAPDSASRPVFLMWSAVRMGLLFFTLALRLLHDRPAAILVQNPPSFPTLLSAWIATRLLRAKLIVDWHNYGFTVLALRLGTGHRMVRLARWYEFSAGRLGDAHLCGSQAMRADLAAHAITARVLYDRPKEPVRSIPRPAHEKLIAVCPLGWTSDDDVALLLDALAGLPETGCAIEIHLTGDGPLRAQWMERIRSFDRPGVEIRTGYLPEGDFRGLLRRADVGVSVHRSTSGLDLAMKVVDLFAACVPVCALDYGPAIREQIDDGITGFLFDTSSQLSTLLARLLADPGILVKMRRSIESRWSETWSEAWQIHAADLFTP